MRPQSIELPAAIRQAQALLNAYRLEAAEEILRDLLAACPDDAPTRALFARTVRELGRVEEARRIQEQLVQELPGDFAFRFDLSETLLLLGDYERGWREYRHRYRMPHTSGLARPIQQPRWDGRPLEGRRILIHDEQGYGDILQFLRFVPCVKERGGHVILEVHPDLLGLARSLAGYDVLIGRDRLPPAFDLHCELMNLPMALGLRLADLPGPMPYLAPDPALAARWRNRLAALPRPLVALAWAGTPTHPHDRKRSLPLARLAPLAAAGITFVSIQKGPKAAASQTPPPGLRLVDLAGELRSFDDTAAILSVVDLLVSADTSPVHLAGALGRPVWTLLPFVPDWRWLLEREDSPWYPTMRLFRQPVRGDWGAVLERVAAEMASL
jgi:hypothetical protein